MGRPRIDDFWEMAIKRIVADNPSIGPKAVRSQLVDLAKRHGRTDRPPDVRTIGRRKKDLSPEELKQYRSFYWPNSMGTPELPWEASRYALELLDHHDNNIAALRAAPQDRQVEAELLLELNRWMGAGDRPTVSEVVWFWRVSLAVPDAPVEVRTLAVSLLSMARWLRSEGLAQSVEWQLAKAPWRSPDHKAAYEKTKLSHGISDTWENWATPYELKAKDLHTLEQLLQQYKGASEPRDTEKAAN